MKFIFAFLFTASVVFAGKSRRHHSSSSSSHSYSHSSSSSSRSILARISGNLNTVSSDITGTFPDGIFSLKITEPWTLYSDGMARGKFRERGIYPVDGWCVDINDPTCVKEARELVGAIRCLSVSGRDVWFSAEVESFSPDPRLHDTGNYIEQVVVNRSPWTIWGKLTNRDDENDERSIFMDGPMGPLVEGRDNAVAPIGELTVISLGLFNANAKTYCKGRDSILISTQASFALVCNSDNEWDCAVPPLDALSPSGYESSKFARFVKNTLIQWFDCYENAIGSPVSNTVANLMNPPADAIDSYSVDDHIPAFSGNIVLKAYGRSDHSH